MLLPSLRGHTYMRLPPLYATKDGDRHFGRRGYSVLRRTPVFGDETAAFRDRVKQILLGTQQIVVNLSGIEYIDSGGARWLGCLHQRGSGTRTVRSN